MHVLSKRALALRATSMIVLLATLVAGCAAPAVHPALDRAGAAVERARSAPRVRALATAELDRAELALEHARAAARAGAPPDQVEHLAYIVSQRAALAEARAAEQVARSEMGKLQRTLGQALTHRRLAQDQQMRAPPGGGQRKRALGQVRLEQDRQVRASPAQRDQQARAPLEEDQREPASIQEDQEAPLEEDQHARAPLEQDQPERASVQEDEEARAALNQDQPERASVQDEQRAPAIESEIGPAIVETVPQDITLSLAQLPFEGAEPTSHTLEQLAVLAERLLREPGTSVSIEAEFDLPEPEARTVMERRVEVVRAILLQRGVAPARLVVRAAGDGALEPPATPSFVESPD